jgi:hypothetical protein
MSDAEISAWSQAVRSLRDAVQAQKAEGLDNTSPATRRLVEATESALDAYDRLYAAAQPPTDVRGRFKAALACRQQHFSPADVAYCAGILHEQKGLEQVEALLLECADVKVEGRDYLAADIEDCIRACDFLLDYAEKHPHARPTVARVTDAFAAAIQRGMGMSPSW